jgi:hypothetical protein
MVPEFAMLGLCQCPDGSQHSVFAASPTIAVPAKACFSNISFSGATINSCVGGQLLVDTCRVPGTDGNGVGVLQTITCDTAKCEQCPTGTYGAGGSAGECEPCVCSKGKEDRDNDASTPCHNRKYDGVLGMLDKVVSVDVASVGSTIYDLIPGEISKHIPSIPELCAKDAKLAKLCGAAKSVLGLDNEAQGTSLSFGPLSVVVTNDDSVFNLPSELVDMLAVTQCPDFEDFMKRITRNGVDLSARGDRRCRCRCRCHRRCL